MVEIYLFLFCLFSVVGWILEFSYRSLISKKMSNPGFMTGFVVPIYGFGIIILNTLCIMFYNLGFIYGALIITFLAIIVLSILELFTGYLLNKLFKIRLWDYSDRRFNIRGYICLYFSLIWGILALLYYIYVFSRVNLFASMYVKNSFCIFSLMVFYFTFLTDFILTIKSSKGFF